MNGLYRFHFFRLLLLSLFAIALFGQAQAAKQLHGVSYESLPTIASHLGMKYRWIKKGEEVELYSSWTKMLFTLHKRYFDLNGIRVYLGNAIAKSKGVLYVSSIDYQKTIRAILTPQSFSSPGTLRHIVIDPGHGGEDPGAQNKSLRLKEKSLVLDLAERLKKKLEAIGYRVTLTRTEDEFIELSQRAKIANKAGSDLFISLHFNAVSNKAVSGIETFAMTPKNQASTSHTRLRKSEKKSYPGNRYDVWNELAAYYVQKTLVNDLKQKDRGVKRARFAVLKDIYCPGILIEGGFVSNAQEGRQIGSRNYRDKIAQAIVDGISSYHKTLRRVEAMK